LEGEKGWKKNLSGRKTEGVKKEKTGGGEEGKLESRPTVTRQHVWFFFGKENNSSRRVILKIELELNNPWK